MLRKKGMIWDTLLPWLIGVGVLILMFVAYFILTGKGNGIIDYIKNIFRFGI